MIVARMTRSSRLRSATPRVIGANALTKHAFRGFQRLCRRASARIMRGPEHSPYWARGPLRSLRASRVDARIAYGEVAEWSNAPDSKSGVRL